MFTGVVPQPAVRTLPVDHPVDPRAEEEGDTIDLASAAPLTIERVAQA